MRLSLTASQLATPAGTEILRLLLASLHNGQLDNSAVDLLRVWLTEHHDDPLPAIAFLTPLLAAAPAAELSPGRRRELQLALELILPQEHRAAARILRAHADATAKASARTEKIAARARARQVALLNRPRRFNFLVAGISHDGRADTIRENMVEDQHVFLVRDPANPFDANAIRIFTKRRGSKMEHTGEAIVNLQCLEIGFVPRDDAADMAPLLDAHYKFVALLHPDPSRSTPWTDSDNRRLPLSSRCRHSSPGRASGDAGDLH